MWNSIIVAVQQQLVVGNDESLELSRRALERDEVSYYPLFWVVLVVFGLVVLVSVLSAIWRSPLEIRDRSGGLLKSADNLFLPVDLFHRDPASASSSCSGKVYLRSISRRRAILLSEQPMKKGQELWLSFKGLPYFHGGPGAIHGVAGSITRLGGQWYVCELKIVHDSAEADEGLNVLISDLRAVPG